MSHKSVFRTAVAAVLVSLVLVSCGGESSSDRQRNAALEECVASEQDRQDQVAAWQTQVSDKEAELKTAGDQGTERPTLAPNPESSGDSQMQNAGLRVSADPLPPDEQHVPGQAYNADGTPSELFDGQADWLALHGELHDLMSQADSAISVINALPVCGSDTTVMSDTTVDGATDTTVSGSTESSVPTTEGNASASDSEMTLEEKWNDCRHAPEVDVDVAKAESTGVFSYTVKWNCLKYMNGESFDQMIIHSFNGEGRNESVFRGNDITSNLIDDTFTFSAPIGAGSHSVNIGVRYDGFDHGWYDSTYFTGTGADFTVPSSVVKDFDACSASDAVIARESLTMNCTVTGSFNLMVFNGYKKYSADGDAIDLSQLADGWNEGRLDVTSGSRSIFVVGAFCVRKCDQVRNDLKAERTIGEDNYWTFKIERPSWCADPLIAWVDGNTYKAVARGVREEIESENFWDDLEFGIVVDSDVAMVRIGSDRYWCNDPYGNQQTESVYSEYIITADVEETQTPASTDAPAATDAPVATDAPTTTVPTAPVVDVPMSAMIPEKGAEEPRIQVPSNNGGLGVSAAALDSFLAYAKTDVPVVVAAFDTGERVAMRRGHDSVLKVPANAETITFTAFKKDGTKVETTAKVVTVKPVALVAIRSSGDTGSGFPVLPVILVVVLVVLGGAFAVSRRRKSAVDA